MKYLLICLALTGLASAQVDAYMAGIQEILGGVQDVAAGSYEELLAQDPAAAGSITLSFTITRDGFVGDVAAECDSVLQPVADALKASVAELRFDRLPNGIDEPLDINVPFEFRPPEE